MARVGVAAAILVGTALPGAAEHSFVPLRPVTSDANLPTTSTPGRSVPLDLDLSPAVTPEIDDADRFWLISTRGIQTSVACATLDPPHLRVSRLDCRGRVFPSSLDEYLSFRRVERPTVIYVHGNRIDTSADAIRRALSVYRDIRCYRRCTNLPSQPIDWVIWSWPSQRESIALKDVRIKAARTDTQGLYLAWLLREHVRLNQPTAMIGYSFGGRIVTGALHALAGGSLRRRSLPGEVILGARIDVGLVAPAMEDDWLDVGGYHELATKNIDSISLLYNQQDVVLKNYWRLNRIRNADALGYSGPSRFAPRLDGSRVTVLSRDCAAAVGRQHSELDYYNSRCGGGMVMSHMIASSLIDNE